MKTFPPPGFPYKWCSASGEDEFGIWLEFKVKNIVQRLRWINPGRFSMGSPDDELHRHHYETQHEVTLSKGFGIADTACSRELWSVVTQSLSISDNGLKRPIDNVSWDNCAEFLRKINSIISGVSFFFPTEAQWEYACRANTTTPFSFGIDITPDQVNFNGEHPYFEEKKVSNRGQTVEVKSLQPNQWGLYEMHGNVWEWCIDWYARYEKGGLTDPTGPTTGKYRVLRGGSAFSGAADCRSAARSRCHTNGRNIRNGFRFLWNPPELHTQKKRQASEHQELFHTEEKKKQATIPLEAEMIMKNAILPKDINLTLK